MVKTQLVLSVLMHAQAEESQQRLNFCVSTLYAAIIFNKKMMRAKRARKLISAIIRLLIN